ncbi:hypothetical protein J7T55_015129 [Diaporthe amygdali]|uniref:uncharacterized protein n=1 Tax=Phomopsis amygdali TaxID=1214568 RepID=UPI0022FF0C83|nr:uncharacterized protein J7T55_015129 [Diaporthe amygdali]KAJ0108695.1 hypothetical protein J7T55_015129 [Diaporthe amygdali]
MAIRETWNRMVRKSFSSSSSGARSDDGHDSPTAGTAGTSPIPSVPLHKSSSRLGGLSKISSWRSHGSHNNRHHHSGGSDGSNGKVSGGGDSSSRKASPKRDSPPKSILKKSGGNGGFGSGFPRRVHPSERPLTEQNLRHQEMLGTFTMKFGRSRRYSRGARSSFSGISPRCSMDSSAGPPGGWDDDCAGCGPGYHRRASSAAVAPDEARIAEESS